MRKQKKKDNKSSSSVKGSWRSQNLLEVIEDEAEVMINEDWKHQSGILKLKKKLNSMTSSESDEESFSDESILASECEL